MSSTAMLDISPLGSLADELILLILGYLDIPDLLALSRTSHHLRSLSQDRILHAYRIHNSRARLSQHLPRRPSLSSLRPPSSTIYITTIQTLARSVGRQLISISLKRSLSRRPPPQSLVEKNVLPEKCYGAAGGVAPGLVQAKKSVERERVKDRLRGCLEGKRERWAMGEFVAEEEHRSVRGLIRRFTAWRNTSGGVPARGRLRVVMREGQEAPTRAHVLGLRRFWEGMASAGSVKG